LFIELANDRFEIKFVVAAMEYLQEEQFSDASGSKRSKTIEDDDEDHQFSRWTMFGAAWRTLLLLCEDPFPDVAIRARAVVDGVFNSLASLPRDILEELPMSLTATIPEKALVIQPPPPPTHRVNGTSTLPRANTVQYPPVSRSLSRPTSSGSTTQGSGLYQSLKRTASVAYNLAVGGEIPADKPAPAPNVPPKETELRPAPLIELHKPTSRSFKRGPKDFKLPLESDFFDWSTEYFQRPQMKDAEAEEPGSLEYNKRLWRRTRNEEIINETQPLKEIAGVSHWQNPLAVLDNEGYQPLKLLFHQFEPHLVISDDRDGVFVWDWHQHTRLNSFSNGNREGTKITSTVFLNEDDVALLMVGSSDGVLKIYRNYESQQEIELLTAWRALSDLVPSNRSSGLVVEWQQYGPLNGRTDV
jgi:regulatory associated protein of mTOR